MLIYENSLLFGFLPEIFLSFAILGQLLYNILIVQRKNVSLQYNANFSIFVVQTMLILLSVGVFLFINLNILKINSISTPLFVITQGTQYLKLFLVLIAMFALPCVAISLLLQQINSLEYYTLFLTALFSSMLLVSAADFLSIFIVIEIQSFCFYGLAAFKKNSAFSVESGLKYFIYGSMASGILLFSLSCLYAITGTLNFFELAVLFHAGFPFLTLSTGMNLICSLAIVGVILAVLFKIGAAPFHFWVPDVYEGAPAASTIIFTLLPKIVLFDLLIKIRLMFQSVPGLDLIFLIFGVLTVCVGSLLAVKQVRLKRFFITSSIAQMGFPIVILSSNNFENFIYVYFFILIYMISALGMWLSYILAYITLRSNNTKTPLYIDDLAAITRLNPRLGYFICFYSFVLSGLPPFAAFFSKFFALTVLVENASYTSAILILLASLVSAFYYIRMIKSLFFDGQRSSTFLSTVAGGVTANFSVFSNNTSTALLTFVCAYILLFSSCFLTLIYYYFDSLMAFSSLILTCNINFINLC